MLLFGLIFTFAFIGSADAFTPYRDKTNSSYCAAVSGCAPPTCPYIQVGHHTRLKQFLHCNYTIELSKEDCFNRLKTEPQIWTVNYSPECVYSECDADELRHSANDRILHRRTCDTRCLNFTMRKYNGCWANPLPGAVLVANTTTSAHYDCTSIYCTPPLESCMTNFDAYTSRCEVYKKMELSNPITCLYTSTDTRYVSTTVQCVSDYCDQPQDIDNGNVTYPNTYYQSTATYTCDTGYNMIGTPTMTCGADILWNASPPSCQIVDCGAPSNISNGVVSFTNTSYSSTANYECGFGHTLNGLANVSCQANGQWGAAPSCGSVDCGAPPSVTNAIAQYKTTTIGAISIYQCASGYTINGNASISCQANGQWEAVPSCALVDCNAPPNVTNATALYSSTTFGAVSKYQCATGYLIYGNASIMCQSNGKWEAVPSCVQVDCYAPPSVTNAIAIYNLTTFGAVSTYKCSSGYTLNGVANISCQANGQWEAAPSCDIVDCYAPPSVTNATALYNLTTSGAVTTYQCQPGYVLFGSSVITCQPNGIWTVPTFTCYEIGNRTRPSNIYIVPCACSTGSFGNMTNDEIIAHLKAETEIDPRETTLSVYKLKCREDNRPSAVVTGTIGIIVISTISGCVVLLDLLTVFKCSKKTSSLSPLDLLRSIKCPKKVSTFSPLDLLRSIKCPKKVSTFSPLDLLRSIKCPKNVSTFSPLDLLRSIKCPKKVSTFSPLDLLRSIKCPKKVSTCSPLDLLRSIKCPKKVSTFSPLDLLRSIKCPKKVSTFSPLDLLRSIKCPNKVSTFSPLDLLRSIKCPNKVSTFSPMVLLKSLQCPNKVSALSPMGLCKVFRCFKKVPTVQNDDHSNVDEKSNDDETNRNNGDQIKYDDHGVRNNNGGLNDNNEDNCGGGVYSNNSVHNNNSVHSNNGNQSNNDFQSNHNDHSNSADHTHNVNHSNQSNDRNHNTNKDHKPNGEHSNNCEHTDTVDHCEIIELSNGDNRSDHKNDGDHSDDDNNSNNSDDFSDSSIEEIFLKDDEYAFMVVR